MYEVRHSEAISLAILIGQLQPYLNIFARQLRTAYLQLGPLAMEKGVIINSEQNLFGIYNMILSHYTRLLQIFHTQALYMLYIFDVTWIDIKVPRPVTVLGQRVPRVDFIVVGAEDI